MDVLVVGAGPVGLTMAGELARHGVSCRIIDSNEKRTHLSKALVLWPRTMEVLDQMGCAPQARAAGEPAFGASLHANGQRVVHISLEGLPSRYAYVLMIPQSETERVLEEHLTNLGVQVERRTELVSVTQDDDSVTAVLKRPDDAMETVRCKWLVGCDGAHSTVRHLLQVPFEGTTMDAGFALADVHIDGALPRDEVSIFASEDGFAALFPIPPDRFRAIVDVPAVADAPTPTLQDVQGWLDRRCPSGLRAHDAVWLTRFHINERKVADYRRGRCFLAGDAAHVHSPAGGQGMNTGMQDAHNLAWKLALVLAGDAEAQPLLDSYSQERSPVAKAVLAASGKMTEMAMLRHSLAEALRNRVVGVLGKLGFVQRKARMRLAELDICYGDSPLTEQHHDILATPWLIGNGAPAGARMPDLPLEVHGSGSAVSTHDLLRDTQWQLFLLGGVHPSRDGRDRLISIGRWAQERFDSVIAVHYIIPPGFEPKGHWRGELLDDVDGEAHRKLGAAHDTVYLVRPDGYVAYRSQPAAFELLRGYIERIGIKRQNVHSVRG